MSETFQEEKKSSLGNNNQYTSNNIAGISSMDVHHLLVTGFSIFNFPSTLVRSQSVFSETNLVATIQKRREHSDSRIRFSLLHYDTFFVSVMIVKANDDEAHQTGEDEHT